MPPMAGMDYPETPSSYTRVCDRDPQDKPKPAQWENAQPAKPAGDPLRSPGAEDDDEIPF